MKDEFESLDTPAQGEVLSTFCGSPPLGLPAKPGCVFKHRLDTLAHRYLSLIKLIALSSLCHYLAPSLCHHPPLIKQMQMETFCTFKYTALQHVSPHSVSLPYSMHHRSVSYHTVCITAQCVLPYRMHHRTVCLTIQYASLHSL